MGKDLPVFASNWVGINWRRHFYLVVAASDGSGGNKGYLSNRIIFFVCLYLLRASHGAGAGEGRAGVGFKKCLDILSMDCLRKKPHSAAIGKICSLYILGTSAFYLLLHVLLSDKFLPGGEGRSQDCSDLLAQAQPGS